MTEPPKKAPAARIRPADLADAEAVIAIHERNGLGRIEPPVWRSCWAAYPFKTEFEGIPIGWVLETDNGAVVGTIGNVHLLYEREGRRYRTALATAWAVDAEYRGQAMHLTTAFFKQKGLDLLINGSASPTASKVLTGLRIPRIPIPDYSSPCFWAASPVAFVRAALRRRNLPGAGALAYPAGLLLMVRDVLRGSGRGKLSGPVKTAEAFDGRFDLLWERIAAGPSRLRAVRTREVLDWKYSADRDAGNLTILTAGSGQDLSGYIVLMKRAGSDLGMSLFDIADIQAAGDDPAVYRDLLLAAVQFARDHGVDAVKLLTGTPAKRIPAIALKPYTYQLPFWQLFYRATPELGPALNSPEAWDFSLFETY